jgi:hypothetical protein
MLCPDHLMLTAVHCCNSGHHLQVKRTRTASIIIMDAAVLLASTQQVSDEMYTQSQATASLPSPPCSHSNQPSYYETFFSDKFTRIGQAFNSGQNANTMVLNDD